MSRESSSLPQASAYIQQLQGIVDDPNADPKQQMEAERLISSLTEGGGAVALAQKYAVSDNGRFEDFVTGEVQALGSGQLSYDNPFLPGGRLNPNIDPNEVSRFAGSPHQVDNQGQLLGSLEDPNTGELTDRANIGNLTNRRDLANSGYGFEQGLMQLAAQYGFDPNDQQVYDIIRQTTGETRAYAAPTGTFSGQEGRGQNTLQGLLGKLPNHLQAAFDEARGPDFSNLTRTRGNAAASFGAAVLQGRPSPEAAKPNRAQ